MDTTTDLSQTIINAINSIFKTLFSSIDNSLYSVLDEITFITPSIIYDSNFEILFGSSTQNGILILSNSILIGFLLYYSFKLLLSHITNSKCDRPSSFLLKLILCGILMNSSIFIINFILSFVNYIYESLNFLSNKFFDMNLTFSELITQINFIIPDENADFNIFSIDGLLRGSLSISLLNLLFSHSIRYILIKLFILLSPFAFLSLCVTNTSWFFKSWAKHFFSLLVLQIFVCLVLLILFSTNYDSNSLLSKVIYVGGIYSLIKMNSVIRDFIGGISTEISQSVNNITNLKQGW